MYCAVKSSDGGHDRTFFSRNVIIKASIDGVVRLDRLCIFLAGFDLLSSTMDLSEAQKARICAPNEPWMADINLPDHMYERVPITHHIPTMPLSCSMYIDDSMHHLEWEHNNSMRVYNCYVLLLANITCLHKITCVCGQCIPAFVYMYYTKFYL